MNRWGLKPCPFCGAKKWKRSEREGSNIVYLKHEKDCYLQLWHDKIIIDIGSWEKGEEKWNQRERSKVDE